MAIVKPFAAIRPAAEVVDKVAALPYDVYNRAEACEVVKKNPLSFLNIDRAETQFDKHVDVYADCVYEKAASLLNERIADGTFVKEEKPCYYIYALTMNARTQTGIVGCSSIDDYVSSVIKKHEKTRADKEVDRIRHVDSCSAQTGPIFLAYRDDDTVRSIVKAETQKKPLYDFVADDGVRHTVWRISEDVKIHSLCKALEQLPATYIADGHHRAASAVKVGLKRRAANPNHNGTEEYNFFLSVLFPDSELMIMPYNRVVKNLNGFTKEKFFDIMSQHFEVEEIGLKAYEPDRKATYGMLLDDTWYKITAKSHILNADPVRGLDVSILQEYLLAPILGVGDPRTDKRIDFVGGIRGLNELERRTHTDMKIAFSMYPTSIEELLAVADAGMLMPPKSTWFEPKLRSGIFIHKI